MEGGGDSVDETVPNTPSQAVLEAVADAEGISTAELQPPAYEPLHAAIDPESLDALFGNREDGAPRPTGQISFRYCGYAITVTGDGTVTLEDQPTEETTDDGECC
ncbi:hypothetical protein D8Y22_11645 [Salinadaptatus halalkaliphilus]|uniref:Halobacterial output domain-containing protein n=1 Tax=Salinadaptatus halalkaliphilus TaxID=2419781 RepID=A0A4S3TKL7_9EURY|nr:HalOD1 output domain-containing protein [Salinadaptatus halalkaliphilus]THE64651.1 hypothetical protein D8Y22_11645 [Salinadaptatus halalkaliphilus]